MGSRKMNCRMPAYGAIGLLLSANAQAGTDPVNFARQGWWNIHYVTFDAGNTLCEMTSRYSGTYFNIAAVAAGEGQRNWGIEFANIDWQWVRDKSKYTITLVAPDRTIDLQMVGGSNQSVFGVVDKEVVDALAMDRKGKLVTVFNGSELLGRFLLDDSAAAIRDVVHCTDAHPATNVK